MKQKDIFNYVVKPTLKEFRKSTVIDKLYDIDDTYTDTKLSHYSTMIIKDLLVSDTIKNYKTDIVMAKIQYANALKYYSILENIDNKDEELLDNYIFLCKMYLENVIVKLFSAYDKTFLILNSIYDLRVDESIEKMKFKKKVINSLITYDKKIMIKVNAVFTEIKEHEFSMYRNNISHNRSESFFRIIQNYQIPELALTYKKGKTIEEIIKGIEEITNIINEQLIIIKSLV